MSATSPTDATIRLYLSEDKSPKQIKLEAAGRKLLRAVCSSVPSQKPHLDKKQGSVSIAWKPVVKVVVRTPEQVDLLWNAAAVESLAIDKAAITAAFAQAAAATGSVQWELKGPPLLLPYLVRHSVLRLGMHALCHIGMY